MPSSEIPHPENHKQVEKSRGLQIFLWTMSLDNKNTALMFSTCLCLHFKSNSFVYNLESSLSPSLNVKSFSSTSYSE